MQIKSPKMVQWPPSPSVEDEATALSHEHSLDASVQSIKSDDQPAMSRGSVDQYPVIIDSPEISKSETTNVKQAAPQDHSSADMSSSDDSAGPPTPPPVQRKQEAKSNQASPTKQSKPSSPDRTLPPKVNIERHLSNRGRPKVYRIQTDIGGDVQSMATGDRRKPSPYTFNRSSTFHDSESASTRAPDTLLSPSNVVASPSGMDRSQRFSRGTTPQGYDRCVQPIHGSKTPTAQHMRSSTTRDERYTEKDSKLNSRPTIEPTHRSSSNISARRSFHEVDNRLSPVVKQPSPSHSRRESKESVFESSGDDKSTRYYVTHSRKSSMRDTRDARDIKDSLRASLTDESSREQRRQAERNAAEEQKKMRRRSSHRRERPIMADLDRDTRPESIPSSAIGGYESRYYGYEPRDQSQRQSLTPTTSDANRIAVEDYFANAFKANDRKRASRGHSPRSSGSALCSPFASPPRTPKSERHSREYFDQVPVVQRPSNQSRISSTEESHSKDIKVHNTLLSVATTGAAHAARASEQATESSSGSSTNGAASAPRSRKPSPVQEDPHGSARNTLLSPADALQIPQGSLMPAYSGRPGSRGSVNGVDSAQPYSQTHPHAYRHFSYSVTEHPQPWNVSSPTTIVGPTHNTTAFTSAINTVIPQSRSARSSVVSADVPLPIGTGWGLPICPRPHPVVGHQDWHTIKGIPEIDICPSCMSTVGNTKYNDHFVRSLPRAYHEASVCAMNNPWIRIAFAQNIRQNQPDLRSIRDVTMLPKNTRPCPGTSKDIRSWFQVVDPQTKDFIPDFFVCSACVRAIDHIFPDVRYVFSRPKSSLNQERSCSLHFNGKHFQPIIEQLDQTTQRCNGGRLRTSEVEPLMRVLRRAARYRPCPRDEMQSTRAWHYLPALPEFTICEECYDEVVWPMSDRPIAEDITKTLRPVTARWGPSNSTGISCQLYSDRMRKIFKDTVVYRDFGKLKEVVQKRVATQQRLADMNKLYEQDLRAGIDRRQDIERNQQIWQTYE